MLRRTMAEFSSGVPVRRLFEAIFGRSLATWICEKRPSAVKIKRPLGVSPNGNVFLPSGAVASATTKSQAPAVASRRLFPCCAIAVPPVAASASMARMIRANRMAFLPVVCRPRAWHRHAACATLPQCPESEVRPTLRRPRERTSDSKDTSKLKSLVSFGSEIRLNDSRAKMKRISEPRHWDEAAGARQSVQIDRPARLPYRFARASGDTTRAPDHAPGRIWMTRLSTIAAAFALAAMLVPPASAQDYPSQPIHMIISF